MSNATPPLLAVRNKETGLFDNVNYVFNDDGTVNWRKMVKPEYLAVNDKNFERRSEPVPESIEGLDDRDLIILLAGLKELANLRGYSSLVNQPSIACPEYVCAVCRINWLPHRDTGMESRDTTGMAMATLKNTKGFTMAYLAEMAENRAFARCIRSFLRINIVSKEEIGDSEEIEATIKEGPASDPYVQLEKLMNDKKITFEFLKAKLIEKNFKGAENFTAVTDIPKFKVFSLLKKLQTL